MEQSNVQLNIEKQEVKKRDIGVYLIALLAIVLLFNQWQIFSLSNVSAGVTGFAVSDIKNSVIPSGIPKVYGNELGVGYDDISPNDPRRADNAIQKMAVYDKKISLNGDKLSRYIKITTQISCEYCCGAQAITFSNGKAACGCAHSQAMRGLAKYLLDKHANEFTDDQILEELGKWKTLFFPTLIQQKAEVLKQKGIELNYINLASNKYRGIEKGQTSSGGMVGGC